MNRQDHDADGPTSSVDGPTSSVDGPGPVSFVVGLAGVIGRGRLAAALVGRVRVDADFFFDMAGTLA